VSIRTRPYRHSAKLNLFRAFCAGGKGTPKENSRTHSLIASWAPFSKGEKEPSKSEILGIAEGSRAPESRGQCWEGSLGGEFFLGQQLRKNEGTVRKGRDHDQTEKSAGTPALNGQPKESDLGQIIEGGQICQKPIIQLRGVKQKTLTRTKMKGISTPEGVCQQAPNIPEVPLENRLPKG